MRHFQKLGEVDVSSLNHQLIRNPQLWDNNTFRTTYKQTPHAQVSDILVRFADTDKSSKDSEIIGDVGCIWHPAASVLTAIKPIALNLMRAVDGIELGRIIISRLKPGAVIVPHRDDVGGYTDDFSRYHIVLQGLPGSIYQVEDEEVNMRTSEIWWFQHLKVHSVINNSPDDRISLMVDVKIWP